MEQSYSSSESRDKSVNGAMLPNKVNVPFPNNAEKPVGGSGSKLNVPGGFNSGLINGKV